MYSALMGAGAVLPCFSGVHGPQEHFLSQETDSLRNRIKPASLEDAPSMAGTFTEPGAKLESEAVALVRKEVMDYLFALDWEAL